MIANRRNQGAQHFPSTYDFLYDPFFVHNRGVENNALSPATDVQETKENFVIKVNVPGFEKDRIEINCDGNTLTLKANQIKEDGKVVDAVIHDHVRERTEESFMRSITLPSAIQPDKVSAKLDSGVLSIVVPKIEKAGQRKIAVQ